VRVGDTIWRRNLALFPQTVVRTDRGPGIFRVIDGLRSIFPDRVEDLVRSHLEITSPTDNFSTQALIVNSAGRVWRVADFDPGGANHIEVEAAYVSGRLTTYTLKETLRNPENPDSRKTFETDMHFNYTTDGQIQTVAYTVGSITIQFPPNLLQAITSGQQTVELPNNEGLFFAQSAPIGNAVNYLGMMHFLVSDNHDGTLQVEIKNSYGDQDAVMNFTVQKSIDNTDELLTKSINTEDPALWKDLVHSVMLTRS
jgi:hypothetical protein